MADWEHVLDALVRERGAALVRYAALLTGGTAEAEDLVQEALVRAFSQGRPLRETHAAEAYVRRAVLTVFLDGYRRRRRWSGVRHLLDGAETTDGPEDASAARADVHAALATSHLPGPSSPGATRSCRPRRPTRHRASAGRRSTP
ncbi:sigma factor [Cellulomonas sp. NS3]|uniref:sigma factor n=1 Tax=Cellulomonas sp. NS3 TaxID=2973977 RepID=UPI0021620081|nr:sigma factor [Cellulomonas sp. NS3]